MKTILSSLLVLGILALPRGNPARAEERPPPLRKGKVLILKNEFTVEGDIERIDDRYCVRRKSGEIWVPAERVLVLVGSLPDAYVFLRGRINLDDPDERLRLGRWCRINGLPKEALAELHAAADLRPKHAETRRLLHYWQQEAASEGHKPPTAENNGGVRPPIAPDPTPIEVTTESLGLFATRVQPILMNTCARCHATGRGGKFELAQVFENTISNRRTLERNLAAVLAEVSVSQPEASPLLIKAVSDHAHTGQAPLHDRQAAPYRTLENWVKLTIAANPHLRDRADIRNPKSEKPVFASGAPRAKGGEESQWGAEARPSPAPPASPVARGEKPAKGPAAPPVASSGGTAVPPVHATGKTGGKPDDPYDPEPFNRKMHPGANK